METLCSFQGRNLTRLHLACRGFQPDGQTIPVTPKAAHSFSFRSAKSRDDGVSRGGGRRSTFKDPWDHNFVSEENKYQLWVDTNIPGHILLLICVKQVRCVFVTVS